MSPSVQLFAVIVLVSLPTVMYGGYALLRLLKTDPTSSSGPTSGPGTPTPGCCW